MINCKNPLLILDNKYFIKEHPEFEGKRFVKYSTLKTKPWLNDYLRKGFITLIPCGNCFACINMHRYKWVKRCLIEKNNWDFCYFITLTYADENLTYDDRGVAVLNIRDIQRFVKYLRFEIKPEKLKYLVAGEYGSQTGRPHYHMILFTNYKLDLKFLKYSKVEGLNSSHPLFDCELLNKCWRHKGWIWVAHDFDGESFAYVVSYSNKSSSKRTLNKNLKYRAYLIHKMMESNDLSLKEKIDKIDVGFYPEFICMSKSPPIGSTFKDEKIDWSDVPSDVWKYKSKKANPFTTKEIFTKYDEILENRRKSFYEYLESIDVHAEIEYAKQKYADKIRKGKNKKHIN